VLPLAPASTREIPSHIVAQEWSKYTPEQHDIWRVLFDRQSRLLEGRAAPDYHAGIAALGIAADGGIPDFNRLSAILRRATRWEIVPVPGLIPDDAFFNHLAHRRFPATTFIRRRDQLDYLQEPDIFHDIFGHVPMLFHPAFADYLQEFGKGGLKALSLGSLPYLARLYWYTVEFGLIVTPDGLRIYGSGIVSSKGETIYALEDPRPQRVAFDLLRLMQTTYRIDDFQDIYFVIESYDQLIDATRPDFTPHYKALARMATIAPGQIRTGERTFAANPPSPPAR
jgi:phenylalanine-4-hydroxylase